jgi:hypothetical protein
MPPRYLRRARGLFSLRPVLISQISGDVGAETCQHGSQEKIDAVESLKARIGSWDVRSSEGTRRDRHIACTPTKMISNALGRQQQLSDPRVQIATELANAQ